MLRKDKSKPNPENTTISTLLGSDTVFEGVLHFKEAIRVDGRIKGTLNSTGGTLIVGEHAVLDADIHVSVAIIRGQINGCVEAAKRIEVYPPARIIGDLCAPVVTIESGVVFNGTCRMTTPADKTVEAVGRASADIVKEAVLPEKNSKNL